MAEFTEQIEALKAAGYIIRSNEEEASYKSQLEEVLIQEKLEPTLKERISELTKSAGLKEGVDIAAYLKEVSGKASKYEKELKALKDSQPDLSKYETERVELEAAYQAKLKEAEEKAFQAEDKLTHYQKESKVKEVFAPIQAKFPANLPAVAQIGINHTLNEAIKAAKEETVDGKTVLIMTKPDGLPMRPASGVGFVTVEAYLSQQFDELIPKDKKQEGTGTKAGNSQSPAPSIFKDKLEAMDYATNQLGLRRGSPEMMRWWGENTQGLK
jgi:hypothetical protein